MSSRFLRPLSVAALSLAAASAPASAGLFVDTPVPFDPTKIRAVRSQESVAAAANDSLTLFAWTDLRADGGGDVYAARVRHDGTVLDPNGIEVAVSGAPEGAPAVSWNGSEWLVVWERNGSSVYAARVAPDGEVLDQPGFAIADGPFTSRQPAAAGLGSRHAVVWSDGDLGFVIMGALVASDGSFDVAPTPLAGNTNHEVTPSIAMRGSTALVAFASDRNGSSDIFAFRFERSTAGPPALVRLDATDVAVSTGPGREIAPAVGASANGWMVAWMDDRNTNSSGIDIFATRVSAAGAVQDAAGIEISDDAGTEASPAVHHNGNEWLVAWSQQDFGQFLRAVANNGNPAAQRIDVSTASGTLGEGAFGGDPDKPILAWSDPEAGTSAPKPPQDLLGRAVAADLSLDAPFAIATQTPNQTHPTMAFGSNRWFVAWVDDRYGPTEGRLRYAVTDSARFEAPNPASIGWVAERPGLDQGQPTAAFDGANFNVFWTEERAGHRQILGARFTPGGAFVDSFTVTEGAWNHVDPTTSEIRPGVLGVAWTDHRLPADLDVWGCTVSIGSVLDPEVKLAGTVGVNDERPSFAPSVVPVDDNSVLLAYQKRSGPNTGSIHGATVLTNPFQLSFSFDIRVESGRVFEAPRLAWNGASWACTYQEFVANDGTGLYVPYVTWIGGVFDFVSFPLPLGPGSYVPANPVVGSTGYNFLTTWSELDGKVDLQLRRANGYANFADDAPRQFTDDAGVDVPGDALQGQGDRLGFLYLHGQDDEEWSGLRLFGADARDTLVGRIVLNEFLANPPSGVGEFYELYNVSGQSFQLEGWFVAVNGDSSAVSFCFIDAPGPGPDATKGLRDFVEGTPCGVVEDQNYWLNTDFVGIVGTPEEGKLPNRGGLIELFSPGGVKVDEVAYGFQGGAPVSPAIPLGQEPFARSDLDPEGARGAAPPVVAAPGDSVELSTARLPDGTDSDNDANDWNLTSNSTPGTANVGTAAALGTSLFTTRVSWNPVQGPDAIELFNPRTETFDFNGWYVGSNDGTQRIGVPNNAWTVLPSLDKRVLRRGEVGAFTTDLDYLTVVYLFDPNFVRVEQIGWSRPDNQQPQLCLKREPDTGGFHNGFDWFTSGGEQNLFAGQIRYVTCDISAPDGTVPVEDGPAALAFRGAVPNPLPASGGALVFSVPGIRGGAAAHVRLRLVDVAGRARATLVDGPLVPGEHRVALAGQGAGIYYAELEVGGRRMSRPVVVVP
jgi:hypothetical protein